MNFETISQTARYIPVAGESKITIELTPEMVEIIERLRGELTPEQFIFLLLKIADNPGSVSRKPDFAIEEPEPRPDHPAS